MTREPWQSPDAKECERCSWQGEITCRRCPAVHPKAKRWGWTRCSREGHLFNTNHTNGNCWRCNDKRLIVPLEVALDIPTLPDIEDMGAPLNGRWNTTGG